MIRTRVRQMLSLLPGESTQPIYLNFYIHKGILITTSIPGHNLIVRNKSNLQTKDSTQ